MRGRAAALLFALWASWGLSSCGLLGGGGEGLPTPSFKAEKRFHTLWSRTIPGNSNQGRFRLSPVLRQDRIYVASQNGEVYCLDGANGGVIWRTELREPISSGVDVSEELVLVGTQNGALVALEALGGKRRWSTQVSGEILAPPRAAGDRVLVQTLGGRVVALDAADGSQVWNYRTQMPLLSLRGTSQPVLHKAQLDQVIVGLADGSLAVLDKRNGALLWTYRVAFPEGVSEIERLVDVDSTPRVQGRTLYAVSYGNSMVALQLRGEEQKLLWRQALSSHTDIALDAGHVYLSDSQGAIVSLERGGGRILWRQEELLRRQPGAPVLLGEEYLAVGDVEGYLYILQRGDGRLVGSTRIDSEGLRAALLARGDVVYAYGNGGNFKALRLQ